MSFRSLLVQSATISRYTAGANDGYGNPARTYANVATGVPCRLYETGTTEAAEDRDTVERVGMLFIQTGTSLLAYDRVVVDGITWEVEGQPMTRIGLTGAHHIEANVRTVTR